MALLLVTVLFAAIAAGAVRVLAHELNRPLEQPWLQSGFAGSAAERGSAPVDLVERRLRRDTVARLIQPRIQPRAAAA